MKCTDRIAGLLAHKVKCVFAVSGGANLHLLKSIAEHKGLTLICTQHEQAASFAADAYARLHGNGVALATSGPGATNLITGIASSYYDSVPTLFLTGNQTVERMGSGLGVRQYGFQATPIVDIVKPVTKFAHTILNASELEDIFCAAFLHMHAGRKGPALIDLPDDIQRLAC